jgi:hypothetical protein
MVQRRLCVGNAAAHVGRSCAYCNFACQSMRSSPERVYESANTSLAPVRQLHSHCSVLLMANWLQVDDHSDAMSRTLQISGIILVVWVLQRRFGGCCRSLCLAPGPGTSMCSLPPLIFPTMQRFAPYSPSGTKEHAVLQ